LAEFSIDQRWSIGQNSSVAGAADESQVFHALAALIEPVCTDLSALIAGLSERQQATASRRTSE
jgi:hypothetical protein